ncbi:MAG TPA: redoxin domain-containing protein [Syntrophobacteraceae bacterium]|nr:redoxin domain-containing protein [Syntrophobacteraceae bacterium]
MPPRMILMLCAVLVLTCAGADHAHGQAAISPPAVGGVLPNLSLPVPDRPEERQYLGLEGKGTFKIPEVRAEVVLIEIFSMYCTFCQKDAPGVNELHRLINDDSDLKNRIKLIGIGAGNSPFEVDTFRKTYSVGFPLFPDQDFSRHEALGKTQTPYFIVIRVNKDGSHRVIYSKVGSFGEPKSFLEFILKESGLKKGA